VRDLCSRSSTLPANTVAKYLHRAVPAATHKED
jgi:hypothetical protein